MVPEINKICYIFIYFLLTDGRPQDGWMATWLKAWQEVRVANGKITVIVMEDANLRKFNVGFQECKI